MGLFTKLIYYSLLAQVVCFIVLSLQNWRPIRKMILTVFSSNVVKTALWKIQQIWLIVIFCVFISTIFSQNKLVGRINEIQELEEDNPSLGQQELQNKISLHKEQRDMYLTGMCLIVSFVLNRYYAYVKKLGKVEEEIQQIKRKQ